MLPISLWPRFDRIPRVFPGLCPTAEEVDLLISPVNCFGGIPDPIVAVIAIHDYFYGLIHDRYERLFRESRLG